MDGRNSMTVPLEFLAPAHLDTIELDIDIPYAQSFRVEGTLLACCDYSFVQCAIFGIFHTGTGLGWLPLNWQGPFSPAPGSIVTSFWASNYTGVGIGGGVYDITKIRFQVNAPLNCISGTKVQARVAGRYSTSGAGVGAGSSPGEVVFI